MNCKLNRKAAFLFIKQAYFKKQWHILAQSAVRMADPNAAKEDEN